MTVRQRILKFIYPWFIKLAGGKNKEQSIVINTDKHPANKSFYSLKAVLNDNTAFDFSLLKGKKILIVNVASDCGYTPQYEELEQLSKKYPSDLIVAGFPSNDFKGQEPGDDKAIVAFCRDAYNVSFPLFVKGRVIKPDQQEVFKWLTDKEQNGWNDSLPSWNFCKYLVDEDGELLATLKPYVSPLDGELLRLIEDSSGKYVENLNESQEQVADVVSGSR